MLEPLIIGVAILIAAFIAGIVFWYIGKSTKQDASIFGDALGSYPKEQVSITQRPTKHGINMDIYLPDDIECMIKAIPKDHRVLVTLIAKMAYKKGKSDGSDQAYNNIEWEKKGRDI